MVLEFTETFLVHSGAQYNRGDLADLPEWQARQALALGVARLKAPAEPAAHRQVKSAPVKK